MRVFVPTVQQGNEWVSPVDEVSGFDRLRIEDCVSVVDRWVPERVRIIREDEGFRLAVADVPWTTAIPLPLGLRRSSSCSCER